MNFFETSAKTNKNISEVFNNLTNEILAANEGKTIKTAPIVEINNPQLMQKVNLVPFIQKYDNPVL